MADKEKFDGKGSLLVFGLSFAGALTALYTFNKVIPYVASKVKMPKMNNKADNKPDETTVPE